METDLAGTSRFFRRKPFAHQLEAVEQAAGRESYAYLLEMGCGKSAILIAEMASLFAAGQINAAVIVAPKSLCLTWQRDQLPEHLPPSVTRVLTVVFSGSPTKAQQEQYRELFTEDPLCLKVLIVNVEALSLPKAYTFTQAFLRAHHALMAVDESTRIKSPNARRTKHALKLGKLARFRRILSGMPMTQSPLDIYCQYEFLGDNLLDSTNFHAFKHRYGVVKRLVINGRSFDKVVGYQRLDELQGLVLQHAYRKLKSECLDLPEKLYERRYVQLTPLQARIYDDLRKKALAVLEEGTPITAPLMLTRLLRLRQCLADALVDDAGEPVNVMGPVVELTPRLQTILEISEDLPGKAVIWSSFIRPIRKIVEELNKLHGPGTAAAFYGDVVAKERQRIVEEFQLPDSPLRFFVGQVHTGGVGITLTAASTTIYHDHDWSLEARAQSEDRVHRIGQVNNATYIDLVAAGTLDELILTVLRGKKGLADQVTGDDLKLALMKTAA
jgi:SNF2 family DNA or RNA helicase